MCSPSQLIADSLNYIADYKGWPPTTPKVNRVHVINGRERTATVERLKNFEYKKNIVFVEKKKINLT